MQAQTLSDWENYLGFDASNHVYLEYFYTDMLSVCFKLNHLLYILDPFNKTFMNSKDKCSDSDNLRYTMSSLKNKSYSTKYIFNV